VYLNIKRTKVVEVCKRAVQLTAFQEDVEMKEPVIPTALSSLSFQPPVIKHDFAYSIVVFPSEERIELPNQDIPWKVQ
jgi:hypothetical protein